MRDSALLRRDDELEISELPNNEMFVYDRRQRATHHLSSEVALVWVRCDGSNRPVDLERMLGAELHVPDAKAAVREALRRLDQLDLLRRDRTRELALHFEGTLPVYSAM